MIFTENTNKFINLDKNDKELDSKKIKILIEKEILYLKKNNSNKQITKELTCKEIHIGLQKVHNNIRSYLKLKSIKKKKQVRKKKKDEKVDN